MLVIPAIDIKSGNCVRLTQGDFESVKVYADDPVLVAKQWEIQGAKMLHIVDLDGAKNGSQQNLEIIKKIVRSVRIPIQVGGGIRNNQTVEKLLDSGVARVVLGTVALEDEESLKEIVKNYADKLVIALETKNGVLVKKGWIGKSDKKIMDTAMLLEKLGVKKILYTDVVRDGMLTEPNYQEIKTLKRNIHVPIIASGGVASLDAIKKLKELKVEEAIIGKALYEKRFTLKEALNVS